MRTRLQNEGEALFTTLPAPHWPDVNEVSSTLRRDFYISFGLSQGATDVHKDLFAMFAGAYQRVWTPDGMAEMLPQALPLAVETGLKTRPPRKHGEIDAKEVANEAFRQWSSFSEILLHQATDNPLSPKKLIRTAGGANLGLAIQEYVLLMRGRPGPEEREDLRESYFRKHVLEGVSSDSFAADFACRAMRTARLLGVSDGSLFGLAVRPFLQGLQKDTWELYHPGESFYPADFRNEQRDTLFGKAAAWGGDLATRHMLRHTYTRPVAALANRARAQRLANKRAKKIATADGQE